MASASPRHNIESPKSRKRVEIDFDKLAKELSDIDEGEGLTTQEVAELLGCGSEKARRFIKKAKAAGICRNAKRVIENMAGNKQRYVSYVFEKGVE